MRLYIVGSVASGKSTLARNISEKTGVPYFSLDEVVHEKDDTTPIGNRKRTPEKRDTLFSEILSKSSYIIEDTGRECFEEGLCQAESIILLEIPLITRRYSIIRRYIRQKLGVEKCAYRPSLTMFGICSDGRRTMTEAQTACMNG